MDQGCLGDDFYYFADFCGDPGDIDAKDLGWVLGYLHPEPRPAWAPLLPVL